MFPRDNSRQLLLPYTISMTIPISLTPVRAAICTFVPFFIAV